MLLLYAHLGTGYPLLDIYEELVSVPPYDRKEAAEPLIADLPVLGIPRFLNEHFPGGTWHGIPLSQLTDGRIERSRSASGTSDGALEVESGSPASSAWLPSDMGERK